MAHIKWEWDKIVKTWYAYNEYNQALGTLVVQNVGRHRHWVWRQEGGILMSPGCLDEVRQKQKQEFLNRKRDDE